MYGPRSLLLQFEVFCTLCLFLFWIIVYLYLEIERLGHSFLDWICARNNPLGKFNQPVAKKLYTDRTQVRLGQYEIRVFHHALHETKILLGVRYDNILHLGKLQFLDESMPLHLYKTLQPCARLNSHNHRYHLKQTYHMSRRCSISSLLTREQFQLFFIN